MLVMIKGAFASIGRLSNSTNYKLPFLNSVHKQTSYKQIMYYGTGITFKYLKFYCFIFEG